MQRTFLTILTALLSLVFIGCGEGGPKTTPVSITITQKGTPLAGAAVTMVSADGNSAAGMTNDSGVAVMEMTGSSTKKGAVPGEYGVGVRKWEIREIPNPSEDAPDATSSVREDKLPRKYGDIGESGFKLTVGTTAVVETFDIPE